LSKSDVSTLLKIGELTKIVTENTSTLRHWTKTGLLEVATTTPLGYQLYPYYMIERCKHILERQYQRYTLEEIIKLVST
jgi:DNA-binding transcriptional MerR regulator